METKILNSNQIEQAVELLKAGELVAFPTETVYGLGADATNETAVKKVYAAKGRPSDNPLIATVSDFAMVKRYAQDIPETAEKLVKKFWPGPLTILLKIKDNALPSAVTGGLETVAFRNPKDELTLSLIKQLDCPIVGPSANTSTKPSPTTAKHVYHDLSGKIAAIIDGGQTEIGLESTIIDLTVNPAVVLRPGQITPAELSEVLGESVLMNQGKVAESVIPKAPGMKYRHYAPKAEVIIVDQEEDFANLTLNDQTGIIALESVLKKINSDHSFSLGQNITDASHFLFEALRYFDGQPTIKKIYVQGFNQGEKSAAYMNRLNKSAAGKHL